MTNQNSVPSIPLAPVRVPVPSFGLVYPENSPFHSRQFVLITQMSPLHEDILMSDAWFRDKTLIARLIQAALVEPANVSLSEIEKLVSGDKEAILLALRVTGYGQHLEFPVKCPTCEAETEVVIDLGSTEIQELGGNYGPEASGIVAPGMNLFAVTLPLSKKRVEFKLPTEIALVRTNDEVENEQNMLPKSLRQVFQQVVSVDGITDRGFIAKTLFALRTKDAGVLRTFYHSVRPFVDINHRYQCETCGYTEPIWLPCDNTIFHIKPKDREAVWLEPFFLLGYYFGMTWETYLTYPVFYRKWLLTRINKEIKSANEQESDIPTKAPHDNTAQLRHLAGKTKQNMGPAKLQRFS